MCKYLICSPVFFSSGHFPRTFFPLPFRPTSYRKWTFGQRFVRCVEILLSVLTSPSRCLKSREKPARDFRLLESRHRHFSNANPNLQNTSQKKNFLKSKKIITASLAWESNPRPAVQSLSHGDNRPGWRCPTLLEKLASLPNRYSALCWRPVTHAQTWASALYRFGRLSAYFAGRGNLDN